jgi:hypothetical protein
VAEALTEAARPKRWGLVLAIITVLVGIGVAVAAWDRLHPATEFNHPPLNPAALDLLDHGEPAVLIDQDHRPDYFLARGPASAKVLETADGGFTVTSAWPGGSLIQFLDRPPAGKFAVEAEFQHQMGNGMSWVGLYVAESHCVIPRGRQHLFLMARYADQGIFAGQHEAFHVQQAQRRLHLLTGYLGDDDRKPLAAQDFIASPPEGTAVEASPPGRRTVRIVVDNAEVIASQVSTGGGWKEEVVGRRNWTTVAQDRATVLNNWPDLIPADWPVRPAGGIGVYVLEGTLAVHRLTVTPLK